MQAHENMNEMMVVGRSMKMESQRKSVEELSVDIDDQDEKNIEQLGVNDDLEGM